MTKSLKEWAKREVELAKVTNSDDENFLAMKEEIDKHYDAAYNAFDCFLEAIDTLDKPGFMKSIFVQLLNGDPLTPIEDNKEDWELVDAIDERKGDLTEIYECKRRDSLFKRIKYVGPNMAVEYTDSERCVCLDINRETMYTGGIGPKILDEMVPIHMPYSPRGKIKIFTEDFKYHEDFEGDFDTVGVLYFRFPDGRMKEVKRFFKEDHNTHEMVEINWTEYAARKNKADGLEKNKAQQGI